MMAVAVEDISIPIPYIEEQYSSHYINGSKIHDSLIRKSMIHDEDNGDFPKQLHTGLTLEQVHTKRAIYGPNIVGQCDSSRSLWHQALIMWMEQFKEPLLLLLISSAIISLLLGQMENTVSIAIAVFLVGTVGFIQEWRSERSLEALKKLAPPQCRVLRESKILAIFASELVDGDVVYLSTGDRVPADIKVYASNHLALDESILTGESKPVEKKIGDQALLGTLVCEGHGIGIVTATGDRSEFGRICKLVGNVEEQRSPLQIQLDLLGKQLTLISFIVIVMVSVIGLMLNNSSLLAVFTTGVSLAVAAIPEGLPIVATLTLALSVLKLSKRGVLVRKMTAVETLGAVSVLCVDKTGTLTENHLCVERVFFGQIEENNSDSHMKMNAINSRLVARLCNEAMIGGDGRWVGNAVDVALREWLDESDYGFQDFSQDFKINRSIPFSSSRKYSMVECQNGKIYWKGALEALAQNHSNNYWHEEAYGMGLRGLRVLALAVGDVKGNFAIVGLVGMRDPLRIGIASTMERLKNIGIKIVMITGDAQDTALSIASELGWNHELTAVSGSKLEEHLISQPIRRIIKNESHCMNISLDVVYRASPEHKLLLIRTFQNLGYVVAMTGDGVNDAPALKASDIGIAMGGFRGTDVARESAKIVLSANDNLSALAKAIEEGRSIFGNVRKFLRFQLSTSISAMGIVALGTIISGFLKSNSFSPPFIVPPMNPIQILFVNIIMDGPPAQSLGVEPMNPKDSTIVSPRSKDQPIMQSWMILRIIITSIFIISVSAVVYCYEILNFNYNGTKSATLTFSVFVALSLANAIGCRSMDSSLWMLGALTNRALASSILVSIICLVFVIHYEPIARIVNCRPLTFVEWTIVLISAFSLIVFEETLKFATRRQDRILFLLNKLSITLKHSWRRNKYDLGKNATKEKRLSLPIFKWPRDGVMLV